jgi:uncharacterized protein (TIGR02466 family)
MATMDYLFQTLLYRARLGGAGEKGLLSDLEHAARGIAVDDGAGQAWCAKHGYRGYTSYASLNDLAWRDPAFAQLEARLDSHVAEFARDAEWDLGGRPLKLDSLWINILDPIGAHSGHIHPHAVVSGTLYVHVPPGAGAIRFEDPRLPQMMAAPPRKARAGMGNRSHIVVAPTAGMVLLWESWLRHEVLPGDAHEQRISISFNYRW